jgi:hypothetical protein
MPNRVRQARGIGIDEKNAGMPTGAIDIFISCEAGLISGRLWKTLALK